MWRELFSAIHTPEVTAAVRRCTQWWEKNCVYLGPKSHHAFFDAFLGRRHPQRFASQSIPCFRDHLELEEDSSSAQNHP